MNLGSMATHDLTLTQEDRMKLLKLFFVIILMPPRLVGFVFGLVLYTAYIGFIQAKEVLNIMDGVK